MLPSDLVRSALESAPDAMVIIDGTGRELQAPRRDGSVFPAQLSAGRVAAMGEMAAGIAHELNQPLAAIANRSP